MKLREYQEKFLAEIFQTEGELADCLEPGGNLGYEKCFSVYREDYFLRLTEALGGTFETVWCVLGDEEFHYHCRTFISENPSKDFDLGKYGKEFINYLNDHLSEDYEFLPDLALFEWIFWELFHQEKNHNFEMKDIHLFENNVDYYTLWKNRENTEFFENTNIEDLLVKSYFFIANGVDGIIHGKLNYDQYQLMSLMKKGHDLMDAASEISEIGNWEANQWSAFFQIMMKLKGEKCQEFLKT